MATTTIGSLTDIWTLLILIVPGFLTFRIINWLGSYELKFDQFVTTIYSLLFSIITFIPLSFIFQLNSFSDINIHVTEPKFVLSSLAISIIIGIIIGLVIRFIFQKAVRLDNAWDGFAKSLLQRSVIVYTTDDKEYKGWIKRVSIGKDEKREICLGDPKLVKRDDKGNVKLINIGQEILFTESNIKRILRIEFI